MKLFLASSALLLVSKAQAAPEARMLPRQAGGRLQNMIDTECPGFNCVGVQVESLECTFERPERPDMAGMDEDEIAQLKSELEAKKQEHKENLLKCACCKNMSVEDILAAKGDQEGSRPQEGGSGRPGMDMGMGSGDGGDGSSRPQGSPGGMSGEGSGGSGQPGDGTSRPGGGSGADGSGRPGGMGGLSGGDDAGPAGRPGEDMDIDAMLAEKCPSFTQNGGCASAEGQEIDCAHFNSMHTNTRGRRRKNILYCGCCGGE